VFDIPGVYVAHPIDGTLFQPTRQIWTKVADVWQEVQGVYVKTDGVWEPVRGTFAPTFSGVAGNFGAASRPIPPDVLPISSGGGGGDSGGGTGDNTLGGVGFTIDYTPDFSPPTESA
jgi:hypothetical protein